MGRNLEFIVVADTRGAINRIFAGKGFSFDTKEFIDRYIDGFCYNS